MGAQSRLFSSLVSGSGKATAVVVGAVMLLSGCGGSSGSATVASTPVIRGDVVGVPPENPQPACSPDDKWTVTAATGGTQRVVTFQAPTNHAGWTRFWVTVASGPVNYVLGDTNLFTTSSCGSISVTGLTQGANNTFTVTGTDALGRTYTSPPTAVQTQAPLSISNMTTTGYLGKPITLTTSGGSGNGAVSFLVTGTGCSVSVADVGGVYQLDATTPATCIVTAKKGGGLSNAGGLFQEATSGPVPFTLTALVTFDANGGSGSMPDQGASSATALTANEFARMGYQFNGWAADPEGGRKYEDRASYPFTASATLYARWACTPLSVTVSGRRVSADRAEVTFTASLSESPWTSFTATATDGGQTATVSQSADSGKITVSGLRKHTGYRFTVTATNAAGCSYISDATNRVEQWRK